MDMMRFPDAPLSNATVADRRAQLYARRIG
jgi:hypothetical protein